VLVLRLKVGKPKEGLKCSKDSCQNRSHSSAVVNLINPKNSKTSKVIPSSTLLEESWRSTHTGSKKRISGPFHDGHEWNQSMEPGAFEWWMKLAPTVGRCTVQAREVKSRPPGKSTWTVTAVCKQDDEP
jgi:hypothetical protein